MEIRELQHAIGNSVSGGDVTALRQQYEALQAQHAEAHQQFTSEREAILKERQQLAATLREQGLSLEGQLKALVVERDRLRAEKEAVNVRFNSEITGREQIVAKIQSEHAAALKARDELSRQLADSERAFKELQKQHARAVRTGQGLLADPVLQSEVEKFRVQRWAASWLDQLEHDRGGLTECQIQLEVARLPAQASPAHQ